MGVWFGKNGEQVFINSKDELVVNIERRQIIVPMRELRHNYNKDKTLEFKAEVFRFSKGKPI